MEYPSYGQSREEILKELRKLAESYTPDWRFDEELSEPGSVIAVLFAELMEESAAQFGKLLERNRTAFLQTQGMEPKDGGRASGDMVFELVKPEMPDAVVPKGAVVLADTGAGQGIYETLEPVYVAGNAPGRGRVQARNPGAGWNLPAGSGYVLERSAGYVSKIGNPKPLTGGTDRESPEEAARRCEAAIRHQYRAVTPGDYESLVRELCREVERVRCFPGYDGEGRPSPGAVTVAVLQKGKMGDKPYFYAKTEEIRNYLVECAGTMVQKNGLSVVLPVFIRTDVSAEIYCLPDTAGSETRKKIMDSLEQFLDPTGGGFEGEGWSFGNLPLYGQIKACLQQTPGVRYGKRITVERKRLHDGKWQDISFEEAKKIPWALPANGQHRITVVVSREEKAGDRDGAYMAGNRGRTAERDYPALSGME